MNHTTLHMTCCSKLKTDLPTTPDKLYQSGRIRCFISNCKKKNKDWVILSAKYGVIRPKTVVKTYDLRFTRDVLFWKGIAVEVDGKKLNWDQSKKHVQNWVALVKKQLSEVSPNQIEFYAPNPGEVFEYLVLLHLAFEGCKLNHKTPNDLKTCLRVTNKITLVHTP